jgi:hypothetical protein
MLALVPTLGTLGAALAVLFGATFRLTAAIGAMRPLLRVEPPRLLFGRTDLRLMRSMVSRPPAAVLALAEARTALETAP